MSVTLRVTEQRKKKAAKDPDELAKVDEGSVNLYAVRMFSFRVVKNLHGARLTELQTPHGTVPGPFFQFVATQAAIRGMVFAEDLEAIGVDIILANTYHLHLRPGEDIMAESGGLHGFMQWNKPITTDSGGYQVFSLGKNVKLDDNGVTFRAPLDGALYNFTPESVIDIQAKLGADIVMPLDVCTPFGADHESVAHAVDQTTAWARRCVERFTAIGANKKQALYGIVQGSIYPDLREKSAASLSELPFFGYSIGGELRDESEHHIEEGVRMTAPLLPADKPRYLMGSGTPEDIVRAVRLGVDQFDCVLPIRNARHGKAYKNLNVKELALCLRDPERPVVAADLYTAHDMKKSQYARDLAVFSTNNHAIPKPYTNSYIHHLLRAETPSGLRLMVLNNIHFYTQLMRSIREIIAE